MGAAESGLRQDHAIILVKNLRQAVRDYRELGFHVVEGGALKGGASNALIPFADGTYLELFTVGSFLPLLAKCLRAIGRLDAMSKGRGEMERRFIPRFADGEGFIDCVLQAEELERHMERIRSRGLDIAGPVEGSRRQADGTTLTFQWGIPHARFPFLISDITPRSLRVPVQEASKHANGAAGIKEVMMVVRDLEEGKAQYAGLLGVEGEGIGPFRHRFAVGPTDLVLVSPGESADVRKHLERRGEGLFAVGLCTGHGAYAGEMDLSLTKQARISLMV